MRAVLTLNLCTYSVHKASSFPHTKTGQLPLQHGEDLTALFFKDFKTKDWQDYSFGIVFSACT